MNIQTMQRIIQLRPMTAAAICIATLALADLLPAQQLRVELDPSMVTAEGGDPAGLVDEQREIIGPPAGKPLSTWKLNSKYWKQFPLQRLSRPRARKSICPASGFTTPTAKATSRSAPVNLAQWREVATYDCAAYLAWAEVQLDVTTRVSADHANDPRSQFQRDRRL